MYISLIGLLTSCYDPVDGCLDEFSSNYSLTADNQCLDCCTYPNIQVSIAHLYNGEGFSTSDTLLTDSNDSFHILNYLYLISNVNIVAGDSIVDVIDSLRLNTADPVYIRRDLAKISSARFQNTIGSFVYEGALDSLTFDYGIPAILDNQRVAGESYFLNLASDSLYRDREYIIHRLQLAHGSQFSDTVIYEIPTEMGRHSYGFDFSEVSTLRGQNVDFLLNANYEKWFENISFSEDKDIIETKLYENSNDFLEKSE